MGESGTVGLGHVGIGWVKCRWVSGGTESGHMKGIVENGLGLIWDWNSRCGAACAGGRRGQVERVGGECEGRVCGGRVGVKWTRDGVVLRWKAELCDCGWRQRWMDGQDAGVEMVGKATGDCVRGRI